MNKNRDIRIRVEAPISPGGFYTATVVWEDVVEGRPVDQTKFTSYSEERAIAYALRALADRLEWISRNPFKAELPGIGPTELPELKSMSVQAFADTAQCRHGAPTHGGLNSCLMCSPHEFVPRSGDGLGRTDCARCMNGPGALVHQKTPSSPGTIE